LEFPQVHVGFFKRKLPSIHIDRNSTPRQLRTLFVLNIFPRNILNFCPTFGVGSHTRACHQLPSLFTLESRAKALYFRVMTRRYALRDDQWERIKDLLPGRQGHVGVTARDNRRFVEAVLYRYRAGIAWRDLPARFGDFRVVHLRHSRWSRRGVWQRVFEVLAQDADNEYVLIDSTIVRAHQHSAGAKKGGLNNVRPLDAAVGA
jgi:transposase